MFESIRGFFQKESRTGQVIFNNNQTVQWSKRNYASFADEGYQKNVIVYQAINKMAESIGAIPWKLVRPDGEQVEVHAMLDLINRPNPLQSRSEFLQSVIGYYQISGNAYIEKLIVGSVPKELYALRSDRMNVMPSETGMPKGYSYKAGVEAITWEADNITGESDIRHIKSFHPLDDWYGLSPIEAGAYGIDQHNESMKFLQGLLQNGAAPSGALELSADSSLTDDQFNRLKSEIDEKYVGSKNAGRPMLFEGGMKWVQMGLTPQAMGMIEHKYSAARDISLALGVPPLLLNIQGDSTYSNYKEARQAFYEEKVIPLAGHIVDEFNVWLEPYLGGLKYELELDQVPAIVEKRMLLWEMADNSTDLTINERRELKGFEPLKEGGDDVFVDGNQIPVDMNLSDVLLDPADAGKEAFGDDEKGGK